MNESYDLHVNPLSVGQIVNNHNHNVQANVTYEEINIHSDRLPASILSLLPNINYDTNYNKIVRIIPLVAIRDIEKGEELYSTYFTIHENKAQ